MRSGNKDYIITSVTTEMSLSKFTSIMKNHMMKSFSSNLKITIYKCRTQKNLNSSPCEYFVYPRIVE